MIFNNLYRICEDHYGSLNSETGYKSPASEFILVFSFALVPILIGTVLGYFVTIWSGFIAASAPVLSVLTGFSINTLVLLMGYSEENPHPYEQNTIKKTKEFTLYSILIGILVIIVLVFGFILSRIEVTSPSEINFLISAFVYSIMAHYFITLLVIAHRLYNLVHP
ncbi:hypothetical protein [Halohasta litorea]|uniref:Uncharacterized protein n=1 Tax=Halohasta litorea TaxID=869891 RepID=A0ABD6D7Y0_9EURY|nr:hypothetical protein [Halohasta litorea]